MHYVYVLQSIKDQKYYVGYTNDLKRRLIEHQKGHSFATAPRRPFKLIYYEAFMERADAEKRELFFKSGWGRQYLKRALKTYLNRGKT